MSFRFRENDRSYGRGPPPSRDDYYRDDRRPHPPSFSNRDRRFEERKYLKEIASKALFLSAKKFYLDIVEGSNSKLLKLSEVAQTGQKSKMMMDMEVAVEFHDKISDFCEFLSGLEKQTDKDRAYKSVPLKNDTMVKDQRRYYLDLMENHRGIFLKVTMRSPTTDRIQLVFPGSGLPEVRDALTDLLSEHGTNKRRKIEEPDNYEHQSSSATLADAHKPENPTHVDDDDDKILASGDEDAIYHHGDLNIDINLSEDDIDNSTVDASHVNDGAKEIKNGEQLEKSYDPHRLDCVDRSFQFEIKRNENGTYLSITESSSKFRSVINVPEKCWMEFVSNVEAKIVELRNSKAKGEDDEDFILLVNA